MDSNNRPDLKINGSGTATGGAYNLVRINGSGRITGDVDCADFVINGSGDASGNVACERLKVNGSGRFGGEIRAQDAKVNGTAHFNSGVLGTELTVSGNADIRGGVREQKVNISGSVKVGGDLNAEQFVSHGVFEIGGLLSADSVDVRLYWHKSRAREIGGERISVGTGRGGFEVIASIFTLGTQNPRLEADVIEGNDVMLENTTAKIVRGNNISLGSGCEIGLAEYTGTLRKAAGARVSEERKV